MIGFPEMVTLAVIAVIVGVIVMAIVRASARGSRPPVFLPPDALDHQLRSLVAQGKPIYAIKLLRQHTGMGLKEAKDAVDGLAVGRPINHPALHSPPTAPAPQADLATRVRQLKEAGRGEQAVHLVRGETGMTEEEALRFLDAL
ncbi:ribosomal protein L7/L12 [Nonomuraea sp. NPDC049400]|uniref:ribosomal protein L7/L12 n=1 Tax=Nonomuraea sp. NPDC049400 TaxID=3364352 RepID=UPI0037AF78E1